jgi:hypothetical protein
MQIKAGQRHFPLVLHSKARIPALRSTFCWGRAQPLIPLVIERLHKHKAEMTANEAA